MSAVQKIDSEVLNNLADEIELKVLEMEFFTLPQTLRENEFHKLKHMRRYLKQVNAYGAVPQLRTNPP